MSFFTNPKLLPTTMVILSVLASVVYAVQKDPRHAIYWIAAAILTASVTY